MLNIQIISTLIGIFAGIGLMVGGCGYAYSTWKSGKNKYKDELIVDLKATIASKEEQLQKLQLEKGTLIKSHQEQITELQKQLQELQIIVGVQKSKLEEYTSILENRDPKTLALLTDIKTGIDTLNSHQVTQEINTKKVAKKLEESNI